MMKLNAVSNKVAANACIDATKYNYMKGTSLRLWYVQIPNKFVIDPMGNVVEPKLHNGSLYVLIKRKRVPISKLPHLNYEAAMKFKKIFVG